MPFVAFPMQSEEAESLDNEVEATPIETEVDLALIEFLGLWEADDGEWLAPSELADGAFVALIETMESLEIEEID